MIDNKSLWVFVVVCFFARIPDSSTQTITTASARSHESVVLYVECSIGCIGIEANSASLKQDLERVYSVQSRMQSRIHSFPNLNLPLSSTHGTSTSSPAVTHDLFALCHYAFCQLLCRCSATHPSLPGSKSGPSRRPDGRRRLDSAASETETTRGRPRRSSGSRRGRDGSRWYGTVFRYGEQQQC